MGLQPVDLLATRLCEGQLTKKINNNNNNNNNRGRNEINLSKLLPLSFINSLLPLGKHPLPSDLSIIPASEKTR
jgi:hypothetical protein